MFFSFPFRDGDDNCRHTVKSEGNNNKQWHQQIHTAPNRKETNKQNWKQQAATATAQYYSNYRWTLVNLCGWCVCGLHAVGIYNTRLDHLDTDTAQWNEHKKRGYTLRICQWTKYIGVWKREASHIHRPQHRKNIYLLLYNKQQQQKDIHTHTHIQTHDEHQHMYMPPLLLALSWLRRHRANWKTPGSWETCTR